MNPLVRRVMLRFIAYALEQMKTPNGVYYGLDLPFAEQANWLDSKLRHPDPPAWLRQYR